jgi:hypothetical protein
MEKSKNLISLSDFIAKEVGPKGTPKRAKYDAGYEAFKLGVLLQQRPLGPNNCVLISGKDTVK